MGDLEAIGGRHVRRTKYHRNQFRKCSAGPRRGTARHRRVAADRGNGPDRAQATVMARPSPLLVRDAPCGPGRKPDAKADSETFNKFGPASGAAGVSCVIMTSCPMDSLR
jgi:hypothetical protein